MDSKDKKIIVRLDSVDCFCVFCVYEQGYSCPYQSSTPPSASSHPMLVGYDAQTTPAPAIPLGLEAGGAEDDDERIPPWLRRDVSEVMESLVEVPEVQQKDVSNWYPSGDGADWFSCTLC